MSYAVCSKTERQRFRLVFDATWKGWELDENGRAVTVHVEVDDEAAGEYVTTYVYDEYGNRVIYFYYHCAYCDRYWQVGQCSEMSYVTPVLYDEDGNETPYFTDNNNVNTDFDWSAPIGIEGVEMAWVNLQTEQDELSEGWTLATILYISDDWEEAFNAAYEGLLGDDVKKFYGWHDMYIVMVENTDGTYSYYLYGYATYVGSDDDEYTGTERLYYVDDFAPATDDENP